jgi:hypothetical protein
MTHPTDYAEQLNAAYARYNQNYNNATYHALQLSLVADRYGTEAAHDPQQLEQALNRPEINAILNCITDVALEICEHPDLQGKRDHLLRLLLHTPVSETTLHRIGDHWANFEEAGGTFVEDFLYLARVGLQVQRLIEPLHQAQQSTTTIQGKTGNAAYELVSAAYALLRAAELVLYAESSAAYIGAQVKTAEARIKDARYFLDVSAENIRPAPTLVLSEDGTYPGIVTRVTETGVHVRWYKWGYEGETFTGWLTIEQLATSRLSPEDCGKRFGGLPPEYRE